MEKVIINVARTENGYCANCELIPAWVVAVSGDFGSLEREVKDSIDFWVECAIADNDPIPLALQGEYQIEYKFDIRSLLMYYQNIFSLSAIQHITGINQRQLWRYASGYTKPRPNQAEKIINGLNKLGHELCAIS